MVIPALVTGRFLWFTDSWIEIMYVIYSGGMWLIATAFVDLRRPRGNPDFANKLMPIGLILSVPISVWDHVYWIASQLPFYINLLGVVLGIIAICLGILSRGSLGRAYSPRPIHTGHSELVQKGLYRLIRHPMYLAAILWAIGWPLLIASLIGSFMTLFFILPSILIRIRTEERELVRVYGEEYEEYRNKTWRLIPGIY
jgi:protein-S-isoprenylcysteine O-methyltransferase Ste14